MKCFKKTLSGGVLQNSYSEKFCNILRKTPEMEIIFWKSCWPTPECLLKKSSSQVFMGHFSDKLFDRIPPATASENLPWNDNDVCWSWSRISFENYKNTFFMLFPWGEYVKEKNHEMANHKSRVFVIVKREEWQQVHAFL